MWAEGKWAGKEGDKEEGDEWRIFVSGGKAGDGHEGGCEDFKMRRHLRKLSLYDREGETKNT